MQIHRTPLFGSAVTPVKQAAPVSHSAASLISLPDRFIRQSKPQFTGHPHGTPFSLYSPETTARIQQAVQSLAAHPSRKIAVDVNAALQVSPAVSINTINQILKREQPAPRAYPNWPSVKGSFEYTKEMSEALEKQRARKQASPEASSVSSRDSLDNSSATSTPKHKPDVQTDSHEPPGYESDTTRKIKAKYQAEIDALGDNEEGERRKRIHGNRQKALMRRDAQKFKEQGIPPEVQAEVDAIEAQAKQRYTNERTEAEKKRISTWRNAAINRVLSRRFKEQNNP